MGSAYCKRIRQQQPEVRGHAGQSKSLVWVCWCPQKNNLVSERKTAGRMRVEKSTCGGFLFCVREEQKPVQETSLSQKPVSEVHPQENHLCLLFMFIQSRIIMLWLIRATDCSCPDAYDTGHPRWQRASPNSGRVFSGEWPEEEVGSLLSA